MKKQIQLLCAFLACNIGLNAITTVSSYTLPPNPTCTTTISAPSSSCNTPFALTGTTGGSGNTGNFALVSGTGNLVDNNNSTATYTPGVNEGRAIIRFVNNGEDGCTGGRSVATATIITTAPPTPSVITGNTSVCVGSQNTYSISSVAGASTYNWTFPSGCTTISGGGTSITEQFGSVSGNVSVAGQNVCGVGPASNLSVTVNTSPNAPGAITGPALLCSNAASGINYSVASVSGATSYNWTVPAGASITSGSSTNSVTVNFGMSGGTVSVTAQNLCGVSPASTLTVTIDTMPATPGVITGVGSVCQGQTGVSYSITPIAHATSYVWTLPTGGTVASGTGTNHITVNFSASASSGNIYVSAANAACNSSPSPALLVTVNQLPIAPGPVNGPANVCFGQSSVSYSVAAVSNATSYSWSLPSGASISSGAGTNVITVNFSGGASSGNISVAASNGSCAGASSANFSVTVNGLPSAPSAVGGNTMACVGSSNHVYSVVAVNGVTYNWSVPSGGTITSASPNTSNSVTVSFANNATTGSVSVSNTNACGTGPASSLVVTLNPLPIVTANASKNPVCTGASITLTGGGASTYTWTGGVSNGVPFPASNQSYTVTGTDVNGCSNTATITISSPPLPTPNICMLTADSLALNNIIYWDHTLYPNADSFIVYRYDVGSTQYLRIGAVRKDSGHFVDTKRSIGGPNGGDPAYGSWQYKIAVRDTCGNLSAKSPYHQSVFVQENASNFTWNAYVIEAGQANPVTGYSFLRDDNNTGSWHVLINTTGTLATDPAYTSYPNGNWRVNALGFSCTATSRYGANSPAATIVRSKSNITNNRSMKINQVVSNETAIYPNPSTGIFTVETNTSDKLILQVFGVTGELVLKQVLEGTKNSIDASTLPAGIYNVNLSGKAGYVNNRLIIVR